MGSSADGENLSRVGAGDRGKSRVGEECKPWEPCVNQAKSPAGTEARGQPGQCVWREAEEASEEGGARGGIRSGEAATLAAVEHRLLGTSEEARRLVRSAQPQQARRETVAVVAIGPSSLARCMCTLEIRFYK